MGSTQLLPQLQPNFAATRLLATRSAWQEEASRAAQGRRLQPAYGVVGAPLHSTTPLGAQGERPQDPTAAAGPTSAVLLRLAAAAGPKSARRPSARHLDRAAGADRPKALLLRRQRCIPSVAVRWVLQRRPTGFFAPRLATQGRWVLQLGAVSVAVGPEAPACLPGRAGPLGRWVLKRRPSARPHGAYAAAAVGRPLGAGSYSLQSQQVFRLGQSQQLWAN
jgi:hypothetical protein